MFPRALYFTTRPVRPVPAVRLDAMLGSVRALAEPLLPRKPWPRVIARLVASLGEGPCACQGREPPNNRDFLRFLPPHQAHWGLVPPFRTAPALGGDIGAFEAANRLLEALGGVAVAGIVGRVLVADARDLLLKGREPLELGLARLGETVGPLRQLSGQVGKRPEPVDEVGELRLDLLLRAFGIEKADALEGAVAQKLGEERAMTARLDPFGDTLSGRPPVFENDRGHGAEQAC